MKETISIPSFDIPGGKRIPGAKPLTKKVYRVPGAVDFTIKRFGRESDLAWEESGFIKYSCKSKLNKEDSLELKFCLAGNMYCDQPDCSKCSLGQARQCEKSVPSLDMLSVSYGPDQFTQFSKHPANGTKQERTSGFFSKVPFEKPLTLCCKTRNIVEGLLNHNYSGSFENIYVNAQLQLLLLFSIEDAAEGCTEELVPGSCRFLASEDGRKKVMLARELLLQHIGEPITIKDLSRKVAINECYLKKGFREMYGTTIFEFYQNQRMAHARYLLYEKGVSVTEVSQMLGYSSISHFSTAFKKQTGLKPCELLK